MTTSIAEEVKVPQPSHLKDDLLYAYSLLFAAVGLFFLACLSIESVWNISIPDAHFFSKEQGIVSMKDFNPDDHWLRNGKYPRCHPLYNTTAEIAIDFVPENVTEKEVETLDLGVKLALLKKTALVFPAFHNVVLSTIILLVGCKHSVWIYSKTVSKDKSRIIEDSEEDKGDQQSLAANDAYWFPVVASIALFSLFLIVKYLSKEYLQIAITVYITIMVVSSVSANYGHYAALKKGRKSITAKDSSVLFAFTIDKQLPFGVHLHEKIQITKFNVMSAGIGLALAGFSEALNIYTYSKSHPDDITRDSNFTAVVNNLLGISFCLLALKQIRLTDFKTGAILLSGLFIYDIFWVFFSKGVFGSNVMVSVATKINAPIKLLFFSSLDICKNARFNMLGLGDIVVPGFFLAFLAEFDCYRDFLKASLSKKGNNLDYKTSFTYFHFTLAAYVMSLITTIIAMLISQHAQPALLYIVPFVLIASVGLALYQGEMKLLLTFSMEDDATENEDEAEEKKKE